MNFILFLFCEGGFIDTLLEMCGRNFLLKLFHKTFRHDYFLLSFIFVTCLTGWSGHVFAGAVPLK